MIADPPATASAGGRRARHRRRWILAALVAIHLIALWLYLLKQTQAEYLARVLDAREQWSAGHLDEAASLYRDFAEHYPAFSRPFLLFDGYPSRARAWYALGRIETERSNVDAALTAYRAAMSEEPGLGQREFRNLLLATGRLDELAADATARLARDELDLSANWDLGAARLAQGRPAEAEASYAAALWNLPAWLARHTRYRPGPGLTAEEADLHDLRSVAALLAGHADLARTECAALSSRQRPEDHYDRLCVAYLAVDEGDMEAAKRALRGFTPSGPEHAALENQLRARLDAIAPTPAVTR